MQLGSSLGGFAHNDAREVGRLHAIVPRGTICRIGKLHAIVPRGTICAIGMATADGGVLAAVARHPISAIVNLHAIVPRGTICQIGRVAALSTEGAATNQPRAERRGD